MRQPQFQQSLIFDLGMHRALDTTYYIDKGFKVIALEANPHLVAAARRKFAGSPKLQDLTLVDRALWSADGQTISFFVNSVKDDWSSVFKGWAEKGGHTTEEIRVQTITLARLFDDYGIPYYVKCDIEGADELFVRQLLADTRRPPFVSIEAVSLDALAILFAAGYDRIQLINQAFNGFVQPPKPAREGMFVPINFNGHMSGLFGLELNPSAWLTFDAAAQNYLDYRRLKQRDEKLAYGWLDFHVTSASTLASLREMRPSNA